MARLRQRLPSSLFELRKDKTARSSAWCEVRHHVEADDYNIPPRKIAGPPAKADERNFLCVKEFFMNHPYLTLGTFN
jgi:hypothetical protein